MTLIPHVLRQQLHHLRRGLSQRTEAFGRMLDDESIVPFQVYVYYPLFILGGLYLWFGAENQPQPIEGVLGTTAYDCWVFLGMLSPPLTLVGKRFYNKATQLAHNESNGAYGGALLQLWGDFGVWCCILLYMACALQTTWWGMAVWSLIFVLMGVPGGLFFTLRSWRRLRLIQRRVVNREDVL